MNENSEKKKYDVGITGYWWSTNYGSVATYYALYRLISDMGYSVLLIDRPYSQTDNKNKAVFSRTFMEKYAEVSEKLSREEYDVFNEICDKFIIGSDQVWTTTAIKMYDYLFFLDFAGDNKSKIAYAASFGQRFNASDEEKAKASEYLKRFTGVSVREEQAVDICRDELGIDAKWVMDPVFLLDKKHWYNIASKAKRKVTDILGTECRYLFAYILNPSDEKRAMILETSERLGLPIICILDGRENTFAVNNDILKMQNTVTDPSEEEWLYFFMHAEYIVTDSQHGSAMSIIFNKQFICCSDKKWGQARFDSLFGLLGLKTRQNKTRQEIQKYDTYNIKIDYKEINAKLQEMTAGSRKWLAEMLDKKYVQAIDKVVNLSIISSKDFEVQTNLQTESEKLHNNDDFIKIRILATLLRDYGVRHIVLSPGGRDVPLVRMFEYNEGTFILHRVTDERSAAYFGLGIAAQLRQPVACVCTSGTAASNYLPAVTEAYYTGIPLIAVTADRYSVYHEQGEDQTIPQSHIYDGVIKKSVTIPEGNGYKVEYQTRRDVSDCILECTHNNCGPVHINIAIENISVGSNAPREAWSLLPKIHPHILRVGFNNGEEKLMQWVAALKRSQRILLVYGQNFPANQQQQKNIETFARKYNCVIVTDHISNLHCAYSLQPHNMLSAISKEKFNEELSPDILITVGGKRLMNDRLTYKIRSGKDNIRHWSVNPDGRIKDFYFRLTSVIEMSQDRFFEWFSAHAGDCTNNGVYYQKWKSLFDKYDSCLNDKFNSDYIQSNFLTKIPSHSILHLGVGLTFINSRKYILDPSVEVFCNMGTNGIDGCTSTFMGQCSVVKDRLCFLMVGDLSFFYDMNSIWNKELSKNIRILMVNNNGTGLLRKHKLKAISSVHNTSAKGWVESTGFKYISASTKEEYEEKLPYFLSRMSDAPLFFEVFCE